MITHHRLAQVLGGGAAISEAIDLACYETPFPAGKPDIDAAGCCEVREPGITTGSCPARAASASLVLTVGVLVAQFLAQAGLKNADNNALGILNESKGENNGKAQSNSEVCSSSARL